MTQLSDLKDAVAALTAETQGLTAQNTTLLAKVDGLISLTDTIKAQLAATAENGQLPPDVLSSLTNAINDSVAAIHAIGTQDAAASTKVDDATARDGATNTGGEAGSADTSGDQAGDGTADAGGATTEGGDTSAPNAPETP